MLSKDKLKRDNVVRNYVVNVTSRIVAKESPKLLIFGVTGSVFTWVQSYLAGRSHIVRLGSHSSNPTPCLVVYCNRSCLDPRARSLGHSYSPFTPLRSPTSLKNTNMLMTHNSSWLSPQVMCMLKYPLSNLVCHNCKPGCQ